jgi:PAS domain S-box-containing protein
MAAQIKRKLVLKSISITLPIWITFVLFVLSIVFVFVPSLKQNMMAQKKESIQQLTDITCSLLLEYQQRNISGELTRSEAQQRAIRRIRNLRYGPENKDYFWINDLHPRMIMHPYFPELEGQDISEFTDPSGKKIFLEFVNRVQTEGAGYVDYLWQWKDDPKKIVQKISYVKKFEPWGWIVGTGIYTEDVDAEIQLVVRRLSIISILILMIALGLSLYLTRQAIQTENKRKRSEEKLIKSEEKHRKFIENAPMGMYTTNLKGEFTYLNQKIQEITGYKKENWLDKSYHPIVHPDDLIIIENNIRRRLEGKDCTAPFEIRMFNAKGDMRWMKIHSQSIFEEANGVKKLIGIQSFVEDISQVKHAEAINKTLFSISNAVNMALSLTDLYEQIHLLLGEIIDVTNFFIVIVNTQEQTLHFPYFVDTVDQDFSSIVYDAGESLSGLVVSQRRPILLNEADLAHRASNKGVWGPLPLIWMGVPLIVKDEVIGVMAVQSYTDPHRYGEEDLQILASVSDQVAIAIDRKRAETALIESEKKYKHLFDHAPAGMYEIDFTKSRFVNVNEAMCQYTGYCEDEFLTLTPFDLLTAESKALFLARLETLGNEEKESDNVEYTIRKKDGQELCVLLNSDFIYDKGILKGARVVAHDITERKKIEGMMIQTEKMMSLGGLAAGMAHEINNPLAGMMQNAQVIYNRLSGNLPANETVAQEVGTSMAVIKSFMEKRGIFKQLDYINQAGGNAAKIVKNMLSFVRKTDAVKTEYSLTALIEATLDLAQNDYNLKKKYDFKQIEIIREFSPDVPKILCEPSKIQQVLFNLLKNASESMGSETSQEKRPRLILRLYTQQKKVCIEIEDNGPGMDMATRKRIFEPFFTTKSVDQGTGLGLSVSYFIIVDDHGGEIAVESTVGKGTRFIIKLPVQ